MFKEEKSVYFLEKGPVCTDRMLETTKEVAEKRGIKSIVVASTQGATGVKVSEIFKGHNVVVITYSTGFHEPNTQELTEENKDKILANGAKILRFHGKSEIAPGFFFIGWAQSWNQKNR